jgi:MFS superfamily sulfate permease-like transporter
VLIAVIGATIVTGRLELATTAGVAVVGPLPQGLPSFQVPIVYLDDLGVLLAGSVAIALVSFADTS